MCAKRFILTFLVCASILSLPAQCPGSDSLLKKIAYLRDSSGYREAKKIGVLISIESQIASCPGVDSVRIGVLQEIGKLYYTLFDYANAIQYFQASIDLIKRNIGRKSINANDLLPAYYSLTFLNDSLKRTAERINALDSCAAIAIRLNLKGGYCLWALYNRAAYCFDIGDYHRCIDYASLCESQATVYALADPKKNFTFGTQYAISSLLTTTNALVLLQRYDEAEQLLKRKVIECKQKGLEHNLGAIYATLAEVLEFKKDYDMVLKYQNMAFNFEKQAGHTFNCKAILNDIGYQYWFKYQKDYDKALQYYNMALQYKVTGNDQALSQLETLCLYNRIANIYVERGKYDDAVRYFQLAYNQIASGTSESVLLEKPMDEFIELKRIRYIATLIVDKAMAFHQKFKSSGDIKDIREAVRIYKIADQFLEKLKKEQLDINSKLFWRSDRRRLYEMAIEACYSYENTGDAFYFFEKSRAVLLEDELNDLHLMKTDDMITLERLRKSINQLETQLQQEDKSSDRYRNLQEEVMKDRQEMDQFDYKISSSNTMASSGFSSDYQAILKNTQHYLKSDGQLVEFFEGDSAVYIMHISGQRLNVKKVNKDSFNIAIKGFVNSVSDFSRQNKNFGNFKIVANELFRLIFDKNALQPGKIIISPDAHYFPIEALITNTGGPPSYLIETHPVSYVHSARFLSAEFASESDEKGRPFLGIAPVSFRKGMNLPSLSGSDFSLNTLKSNFKNANALVFENASRNNFIQQFSSYEIIQLYTHAADNKKNGGEPEIFFADSALFLSELMSNRKPLTRLIVLSACESGNGKWYRGEGVFSFNRGFAALGIPSSIANLWSVDNASTYQLTEFFYRYLSEGLPIDVSLQKAKLDFIRSERKEYSLPYYWAGTILTGKTNSIIIQNSFSWATLGFVLSALTGLAIIFYIVRIKRRNKIRIAEAFS